MDKLQAGLCTAHKHTEEISQIIDILESRINRNECNREILENLAIININLPTIKFALENILDISGVVVTTDIDENGIEFTRYLEDAQFNSAQEDERIRAEERTKRELESNDGKSDEGKPGNGE